MATVSGNSRLPVPPARIIPFMVNLFRCRRHLVALQPGLHLPPCLFDDVSHARSFDPPRSVPHSSAPNFIYHRLYFIAVNYTLQCCDLGGRMVEAVSYKRKPVAGSSSSKAADPSGGIVDRN